jgi:hypothetical protein
MKRLTLGQVVLNGRIQVLADGQPTEIVLSAEEAIALLRGNFRIERKALEKVLESTDRLAKLDQIID